ncbi:hypothetical protein TGAM01_v205010 [Trichoderma gamsii]|uniref:Uncharacterized protein n=1 Tax=Trichoderma gamsii TaxID=398673 RepID=A0A2P4ZP74_9HYPO|nr:hypothetical protein TGAM01_v205010 [Trichoderma gamsii]PON26066.1 hypothetical protein TGAM01_v205010 [Trichoderma gamsii]
MGAGECIDASGPSRFIRASALLCIASSRLAAGRSQLIVRLAVASHPYRGGCSRSRDGQAQMHGWSSDFGAAVESGAARACGSMAAAVEAPRCVAAADWTRQMQVRATAWPIGGSITPGRRDPIAESRPAKLRRRDQGFTTKTPSSSTTSFKLARGLRSHISPAALVASASHLICFTEQTPGDPAAAGNLSLQDYPSKATCPVQSGNGDSSARILLLRGSKMPKTHVRHALQCLRLFINISKLHMGCHPAIRYT